MGSVIHLLDLPSVDSHDRSTQAADPVETGGYTGTCTSIWSRKDFRRATYMLASPFPSHRNESSLCVKNTVHDVLEEGFQASHCKLKARFGAYGENKKDNSG